MKIARNCTLVAALIHGSDPTRYGTLIADLANHYSKGKEISRPHTTAYLSVNYRTPANGMRNRNNNSS